MKYYLRTLLWLFAILTACQQTKKSVPEESAARLSPPFSVGFRVMKAVDRSRMYRPDTKLTDTLHFRPLDMDVWYPAQQTATDTLLPFRYFLGLLESRATFYSAPKTFDGLTYDFAKSFCEIFQCSHPDSLLAYVTQSRENATVLPDRFPLIIYLASFGSMSYENIPLMEQLAQQGYVVVSVSSIGTYPGDMTMKTADLMAQVQDATFVIDQMKRMPYVDSTRIGLVGYSWGGFAGAILAMQCPDITALVSLDGSEFHHYIQKYDGAKKDDQDFEATVSGSSFKNMSLTVPYLRLESNPQPDSTTQDSVYHFLDKVKDEKHIYKITSADHGDFSGLPFVVKSSGNCPIPPFHSTIRQLTLAYLDEHVKKQSGIFAQTAKKEIGKTITNELRNQ